MKYTALTIGPIIKSLGLAHKTRELWAASYFFSSLMEEIINIINQDKAIILPHPNKDELVKSLNIDKDKIKSAGVFPDRLILESDNGLFTEMEKAVKSALTNLKTDFGFSCNETDITNYISTHIIEFEYDARVLKDKDGNLIEDNIIYQTNDFLANCELQANYTAIDNKCFLNMFDRIAETKFYKKKFPKGFPSILEISTQGINTTGINLNDDKVDDNTIWEQLKELNDEIKIHHKYITIVQADGDSIGEIIKQVAKEGSDKIKDFSKALSSFSLLAAQEITDYKGIPVYTGGDDLLFFAPVNNGEINIFQLINKLDDIFKKNIIDEFETTVKASMSYGVSISYYKYPMHEALNTARDLLFKKAKQKPKNAIAFKVLKHSGQIFETVLQKKSINKGEVFADLLKQDKGLVINSLMYKFEKHKVLLEESLKKDSNAKLNNFFNNFYNEDIHNNARDFINNVKKLLQNAYANNDKNFDKTICQVYAQLRFIKFLNTTKDD